MPTIHEDPVMEFVNLDMAGPPEGTSGDMLVDDLNYDFDLALENVEGDDFSFWALQHFENSHLPSGAEAMDVTSTTLDPMATFSSSAPAAVPAAADSPSSLTKGSTPQAFEDHKILDVPCEKCQINSYLCKKIPEGKYKGYCTSCVALRCECSFGLAAVTRFPYNPWPTLGDHPDAIPDDICITLAPKPTAAEASNDAAAADGNNESGASAKDPNANTGAAPGPKVGARFSRESVKILKNWLSTHNRHPYPNEEEKEMLQKQTGLNKTQITNWLANARRRNKIAAPRSTSPGVRAWTTSAAIDIPPPPHMAAPHRRGTPMPALEHMNPLQRWQVSPPEHEPASVTDIARAVSSSTLSRSSHSPGLNSPFSMNFTDDGSAHSLYNASSASSINTSHSSGGSFASAFSHGSKASLGSFSSMQQNHRGRRRRRRRAPPATGSPGGVGVGAKTSLAAPLKTYMCTFCTETFRTKHDWQRHEKSLHLSLERWVCCPDGPKAFNPETGQVSCVFCGCANPDEDHLEKQHNHGACQERTLEERTFYRKDHLRQHLKLVHGGAKFAGWAMEAWKVSTPEIRSRCGFCGIVMDTWTIRVDHLAEHFKGGNTMADWVGDWGFDTPVLQMVENSMPPYLIHDERQTPLPYKASQGSPESPRNAYELLKSELDYFRLTHWDRMQRGPTDEEMRVEACRIVFGAEVLSHQGMSAVPSWLRDLLVADIDVARRARMAPIRSPADSRQARLAINGKDNIFENDPMERELLEYVKARELLGLTAMDTELQVEACKILSRMEESSARPSDDVANFLLRLIHGSPKWLADFRQRACLPRSEDVADEAKRSRDPTTIDSTIHNYSRLEAELAEYVRNQRSMGMEPTDADLQKQARIIIYEFDDGWNQTAADNVDWLSAFKRRHVDAQSSAEALASGEPLTISSAMAGSASGVPLGIDPVSQMPLGIDPVTHMPLGIDPVSHILPLGIDPVVHLGGLGLGTSSGGNSPGSRNPTEGGGAAAGTKTGPVKLGAWFLNDANCYRRLARELGRWVNASMSPNNPNCHVPSDEEIQHQARWILYDSDDPWNQTAADNAEWLRRFKRETGILTDPSLPGLPEGVAWNITQGGTGFAPPYAFPNPSAGAATIAATAAPSVVPFDVDKSCPINVCSTDGLVPSANTGTSSSIQGPSNNATGTAATGMLASATPEVTFPAEPATANKWLAAFGTRGLAPPATVFCSRELENGLAAFVGEEVADRGVMPSDDELQARARDILGTQTTAADDVVLLEKFKGMMRGRLGLGSGSGTHQRVAGMTVGEAGSGSAKIHPGEQQQGLMDIDLSGLDGTDLTDIILQDMEFDFDFGDVVDLSPLEGEN